MKSGKKSDTPSFFISPKFLCLDRKRDPEQLDPFQKWWLTGIPSLLNQGRCRDYSQISHKVSNVLCKYLVSSPFQKNLCIFYNNFDSRSINLIGSKPCQRVFDLIRKKKTTIFMINITSCSRKEVEGNNGDVLSSSLITDSPSLCMYYRTYPTVFFEHHTTTDGTPQGRISSEGGG